MTVPGCDASMIWERHPQPCECDTCRLWRDMGRPDPITWLRNWIEMIDRIPEDKIDEFTGSPLRAECVGLRFDPARWLAHLEAQAN
jgi:hypothetical protein